MSGIDKEKLIIFRKIMNVDNEIRGLNTLSGSLSGFLLYILETREYCDVIKVLLHSKFSDHEMRT